MEKPANSPRGNPTSKSSSETSQTVNNNCSNKSDCIQSSKVPPSGIPDTDICAICLNDYEIGDEICWSQNDLCNHAFHKECMMEWLLRHKECPCCRNIYIPQDESSLPSRSQRIASDYLPRLFFYTTTTRSNDNNRSGSNTTMTAVLEMTPRNNDLQNNTNVNTQISPSSILSIEGMLHRLSIPGSRISNRTATLNEFIREQNGSSVGAPSTGVGASTGSRLESSALNTTIVAEQISNANNEHERDEDEPNYPEPAATISNDSSSDDHSECDIEQQMAIDDNLDSEDNNMPQNGDLSSYIKKRKVDENTSDCKELFSSDMDIDGSCSESLSRHNSGIHSDTVERINDTNLVQPCVTEIDACQRGIDLESNISSNSKNEEVIMSCENGITESKIVDDPVTDRLSASMLDNDSNNDVDTIYHSVVSTDEEPENNIILPDSLIEPNRTFSEDPICSTDMSDVDIKRSLTDETNDSTVTTNCDEIESQCDSESDFNKNSDAIVSKKTSTLSPISNDDENKPTNDIQLEINKHTSTH